MLLLGGGEMQFPTSSSDLFSITIADRKREYRASTAAGSCPMRDVDVTGIEPAVLRYSGGVSRHLLQSATRPGEIPLERNEGSLQSGCRIRTRISPVYMGALCQLS